MGGGVYYMDVRTLRYFTVVAEEEHLTKAAKRLNMTQPPLGYQIKLLEEELGIKLLDRNGKNIGLTEDGRIIYEKSKYILNQFEKTVQEMRNLEDLEKGEIRLGVAPNYISDVAKKIEEFRSKYPFINFKIIDASAYELIGALKSGDIEIAFMSKPISKVNLEYKFIERKNFVLVVPNKFAHRFDKKSINLNEIGELPLVSLAKYPEIDYREFIVTEFNRVGMIPNIVCECNNVAMALILVSEGIGGFIMGKSNLALFKNKVKAINIKDFSIKYEGCIVWDSERKLSKKAEGFLELF